MSANESRTVSSANETSQNNPKKADFLSLFRQAAGIPLDAPRFERAEGAAIGCELIDACHVAGFDAQIAELVSGVIGWAIRGRRVVYEGAIQGWLDEHSAAELRSLLKDAPGIFLEGCITGENTGIFSLPGYYAFREDAAAAALYFIVATGHLVDFAELLRILDRAKTAQGIMPAQWPEMRSLLLNLVGVEVEPLPEGLAENYCSNLAAALQGVSHE